MRAWRPGLVALASLVLQCAHKGAEELASRGTQQLAQGSGRGDVASAQLA